MISLISTFKSPIYQQLGPSRLLGSQNCRTTSSARQQFYLKAARTEWVYLEKTNRHGSLLVLQH